MTIPPGTTGSGSWSDLLEAVVTAYRDVRTLTLELNEREAVLGEAIDELVLRIVTDHAVEIISERDLRGERDPVTRELLEEMLP